MNPNSLWARRLGCAQSLASTSNYQQLPATTSGLLCNPQPLPAISNHFQPFPAISSHCQPCQPFPTTAGKCQPMPARGQQRLASANKCQPRLARANHCQPPTPQPANGRHGCAGTWVCGDMGVFKNEKIISSHQQRGEHYHPQPAYAKSVKCTPSAMKRRRDV